MRADPQPPDPFPAVGRRGRHESEVWAWAVGMVLSCPLFGSVPLLVNGSVFSTSRIIVRKNAFYMHNFV